jgi:hypothetical protein
LVVGLIKIIKCDVIFSQAKPTFQFREISMEVQASKKRLHKSKSALATWGGRLGTKWFWSFERFKKYMFL